MSAITTKPCCVACGKEIPVLKCENCFQAAGSGQSVVHCQETNNQSDQARGSQQTLKEQTANSQQPHALIQQVDDWECNSIKKIRQTADEARRLILKHTTERISEVEAKITKVTDQLRQCHRDNNFVSKNICEWQEELIRLSKQLVAPSSITVRQVFTPFVSKIHVDVPGKNSNYVR
jgi:chromosome segregation ATPase